jgi:hypothetical protein
MNWINQCPRLEKTSFDIKFLIKPWLQLGSVIIILKVDVMLLPSFPTWIKYLHWVMQEWDGTSQQANCFDEIFKPQIELNNILKESQVRSEILVDIELNSPNITNTISFPLNKIGFITLPYIDNTCIYHFNVCIGMQCVGPLPSYLWEYKTTSSANITSMNAYECNAYVLCLDTSKGMWEHLEGGWIGDPVKNLKLKPQNLD